jgi:hypothetical protein
VKVRLPSAFSVELLHTPQWEELVERCLFNLFSSSCTHGVKPTIWETQLATSQRSVSVLSPPCSVVPLFRKEGPKLYLKGTKLVTVVVSCLVYVHCTFSQRYTIVPLQFDPLESQLCHATISLIVIS